MNTTVRKPLGIVVRDEDLPLFAKTQATDIFSHENMSVTGQIITTKQEYNLEGIKKLLSDEEYYMSLVEFMKDTKKAKVHINKIRDLSLAINKSTFVPLVKTLAKDGKLEGIPDLESKIKTLEDTLALDNLRSEENYTTTIAGKEISIPVELILEYIKLDGKLIDHKKVVSLYGYDPKEFVFAVKKFTEEKKLHTNFLLDSETLQFVSDLKLDQVMDTMSLEAINETKDHVKPVGLHPELIKYVFNNMPTDYSDIEKAIFVYLKLARAFTYDDEFYAEQQSDEANAKHSNIARLSTITPTNNSVVCYEVNQIFAQILKMLNINYSVDYVLGQYGQGHSNLSFKADDYIVKADAVATILGSDMLNSKVNNDITGLTCQNKNAAMKTTFKNILNGVYNDIKKLDPSPYVEEDSFDRWKDLLTIFIEDPVDVTIKDKIEIFTKIATLSTLPRTEKIAYLTKIYNRLFSLDKTTYMTIISQKKEKEALRKPTLVITYNEEEEISKFEKNKYVLLNGENWQDITLLELQTLFSSGELGYISNKTVPGIDLSKKETPTLW